MNKHKHKHNKQTSIQAIILKDLVTTGMVVWTTYDVSVCEMQKEKVSKILKWHHLDRMDEW